MKKLIATKTYRPQSVSVAHIEPLKVCNVDCWKYGTGLRTYGNSDAENIEIRRSLRDHEFHLTASKRPGHFVLSAWSTSP